MDEAVRDARDTVLEAYDDSMTSPNFEADREHDERFIAALDAYEAAIRADERAKVETVIEAARQFDTFIQMVDSGMTVFPLDPEHEDSEQNVYIRVREQLGAAVAAINAVRAGRAS